MSEHKIHPPAYGLVFVALIVLTGLTVWLASVDLGPWHVPVGLAIAATKATVIALFFMHVLYSPRLTWMVVFAMLLFLAILLFLTLTDYLSRDWQTAVAGVTVPMIGFVARPPRHHPLQRIRHNWQTAATPGGKCLDSFQPYQRLESAVGTACPSLSQIHCNRTCNESSCIFALSQSG